MKAIRDGVEASQLDNYVAYSVVARAARALDRLYPVRLSADQVGLGIAATGADRVLLSVDNEEETQEARNFLTNYGKEGLLEAVHEAANALELDLSAIPQDNLVQGSYGVGYFQFIIEVLEEGQDGLGDIDQDEREETLTSTRAALILIENKLNSMDFTNIV